MTNPSINCLQDLQQLRSAPSLDQAQREELFNELLAYCKESEWFTVGIMAASKEEAIAALRQIEKRLDWSEMKLASVPTEQGPVFLKANQSSREIHIRIEHGLGEGILIGCQNNEPTSTTNTLGPLPLDFFNS